MSKRLDAIHDNAERTAALPERDMLLARLVLNGHLETSDTKAWIKSREHGYYVGSCLGLGFFQSHIEDGTLSPDERPIEFDSVDEAQRYLDSWVGGSGDCYVTVVAP